MTETLRGMHTPHRGRQQSCRAAARKVRFAPLRINRLSVYKKPQWPDAACGLYILKAHSECCFNSDGESLASIGGGY